MAIRFPLGSDPAAVRLRVEAMERLLERSFVVPGFNRAIGLDSLIGLVPVAGDLIGGAFALYLVWEGRNLGMSRWQIARMLANIGFDTLLAQCRLRVICSISCFGRTAAICG